MVVVVISSIWYHTQSQYAAVITSVTSTGLANIANLRSLPSLLITSLRNNRSSLNVASSCSRMRLRSASVSFLASCFSAFGRISCGLAVQHKQIKKQSRSHKARKGNNGNITNSRLACNICHRQVNN